MFRQTTIAVLVALWASNATGQEWRSLPLIENGQVASSWQHVGWGKLVVAGDAIRTEPDQRGLGVLVYTPEKFGNCQIRVVYRTDDARDNAGVHIRMDDGVLKWIGKDSIAVKRNERGRLDPDQLEKLKEASEKEEGAWYAVHHGFEVQISDGGDSFHRTGSIYSYAPASELPARPVDQWRTMVITLDGELVTVELDGKVISNLNAAAPGLPARKSWMEPKREYQRPTSGYLGLQTHDPGDIVHFREVSVRPLPTNSATKTE